MRRVLVTLLTLAMVIGNLGNVTAVAAEPGTAAAIESSAEASVADAGAEEIDADGAGADQVGKESAAEGNSTGSGEDEDASEDGESGDKDPADNEPSGDLTDKESAEEVSTGDNPADKDPANEGSTEEGAAVEDPANDGSSEDVDKSGEESTEAPAEEIRDETTVNDEITADEAAEGDELPEDEVLQEEELLVGDGEDPDDPSPYSISVNQDVFDFGSVIAGYTADQLPEAQTLVVSNNGTETDTVLVPRSDYYDIKPVSDSLTIGPGQSCSFTIQPKLGLLQGDEEVSLETEYGSWIGLHLFFTINHGLKGNVKASDLIDGACYYITGNTVITIASGDRASISAIYGGSAEGCNLEITGSEYGTLYIEHGIYGSEEYPVNSLTFSGGNVVTTYVSTSGDISVTGGSLKLDYLKSLNGTVSISGGSVNASINIGTYAIEGKDIAISGGTVNARSDSHSAIYAPGNITVSGGSVTAYAPGDETDQDGNYQDAYGIFAGGTITFEGSAFVTAEAKIAAVYGPTVTFNDGIGISRPAGAHMGGAGSSHPGQFVDEDDTVVKNIVIRDIGETEGAAIDVRPSYVEMGEYTLGESRYYDLPSVSVTNTGTCDLLITGITPNDSQKAIVAEDFEPALLKQGESTKITLNVDTELLASNMSGDFGGGVTINTDIDGVVGKLGAHYRVVKPRPSIAFETSSELNFGNIPLGIEDSISLDTTICNSGNIDLYLTDAVLPEWLWTDVFYDEYAEDNHQDVYLSTGMAVTFPIYVKCDSITEEKKYEGQVKFKAKTDDGKEATVSGTATLYAVNRGDDLVWIDEIPDCTYDGSKQTPEVRVFFRKMLLNESDYTVSYKNNINAAKSDAVNAKGVSIAPTVTVKCKGNYSGTASKTFNINPLDISRLENEAVAEDVIVAYTGKEQKAKTKVTCTVGWDTRTLKEGKEYTLDYGTMGLTEPGDYDVKVTGIGNFTGSIWFTETIAGEEQTLLSKVKAAAIPDQTYCGKQFVISDPWGDIEKQVTDKKGNPYELSLTGPKKEKLKIDVDYEIYRMENNLEVGTAKVTLVGIGKYAGFKTLTFKIKGTPLSKVKTEGFVPSFAYSGSYIDQPMRFYYVEGKGADAKKHYLTEGVDYEATFYSNSEVGTAIAEYTGRGGYTGTVIKKYKITGMSMSKVTVPKDFSNSALYADIYDAASKSFIYIGNPIEAAGAEYGFDDYGIKLTYKKNGVPVTLRIGYDYEVYYSKNENVGTATVTFEGCGGFTGKVKRTFKIKAYDMQADERGSLAIDVNAAYDYNKNGVKPLPEVFYDGVELVQGKDYTVSWGNNKAVTPDEADAKKATVTIKFKGNFKGTVSREFKINRSALIRTTVSVKDVIWKDKADNYVTTVTVIEDSTKAKLKAGTDYLKNLTYSYKERTEGVKNGGETVTREPGADVVAGDIVPAGTELNARVFGYGSYVGSWKDVTFRVIEKDISTATVTLTKANFPRIYTGEEITIGEADLTVMFGKNSTPLVYGTDFEIDEESYVNNIGKGTAKVTIRGLGKYGGSKVVSFSIAARAIPKN